MRQHHTAASAFEHLIRYSVQQKNSENDASVPAIARGEHEQTELDIVGNTAAYGLMWIECSLEASVNAADAQEHSDTVAVPTSGSAGPIRVELALEAVLDSLQRQSAAGKPSTKNADMLVRLCSLAFNLLLEYPIRDGTLQVEAARSFDNVAAILSSLPTASLAVLVARLKCHLRAA